MLTVNGTKLQKHQVRGPVGYTVVGSPTIVDGIVSGFSATSYPETSMSCPLSNEIEYVCKFKVTEEANRVQSILRIGGGLINITYYTVNNTMGITAYDAQNNYFAQRGTTSFSLNTYYWVKFTVSGSQCRVSMSTDGKNYITEIEHSYSLSVSSTIIFGSNVQNYLLGEIDLNQTHIKVNGKLWFYQPADTKYIVKDGKLVWADPRIYIDDNGTKTYATQDVAPVPAGYTLGNIITPGIGYVDMRTQAFTAAPAGATIGRDE